MKTVVICLTLLVCLLGLSRTNLIRDYLRQEHTAQLAKPSGESYRACLKRESAGLGVTNIQQMQKCEEETSNGK